MGINSGIYKLVLVLHILTAIIGFGAVFLNGIYGQQARSRRGSEGLAISQANFLVSRIGQYFIYAVFIFGVLLVVLSDDVWELQRLVDRRRDRALRARARAVARPAAAQRAPDDRVSRTSWSRWARRRPARPPASRRPRSSSSRSAAAGHGSSARVLQLDLVLILMLMVWGPRF